ncbi:MULTISPECIES: asparagine synthase-related protein [Bacillota]|uniref:asparagine synthase-related protein n=1 Tax=Bacillota TaxID=1239 RepID=UPI0023F57298|nr:MULTISPECIES: asparagine synthase-related protein [Bacillota]MDD7184035.1 asparagine synthase-related protein [Peptostreptococcus porci]MDY3050943.1 asparagine synthase-related protein [Parvimonas sp.]
MQSSLINEIKIDILNKMECVLITKNKYCQGIYNGVYICCLESFKEQIKEILQNNCYEDKTALVNDIEKIIDYGIYIFSFNGEIVVGGEYLGTMLSWMRVNNKIVISDSAVEIAKKYKLKLSNDILAMYLILGLPFYPFYTISFWKEISKIRPFSVLIISETGEREEKITKLPSINYDKDLLLENIRKQIIDKIHSQSGCHRFVSCDVSGGVDSSSIAYVLNKMLNDFKIFHAESDKSSNSDTKWAEYIAKDLGNDLNKLLSVEISGKRFSVDDNYIGNHLPDSPLLWADTEGYVQELLTKISTNNVHFIGIGGDELYTPMPSTPWSIVHQEKIKSIIYMFKYGILTKNTFIRCVKNLLDGEKYSSELNKKTKKAFEKIGKINISDLSWMDSISIPEWLNFGYVEQGYQLIKNIISKEIEPLDVDRGRHQALQSIIFQKRVFSQIKQSVIHKTDCYAPFLNKEIIQYSLMIPAKYCSSSRMTKPMLYEALKGIVPEEVFTRGVKGDYSKALYEGYKLAAKKFKDDIKDFELVKRGIIDEAKLRAELSMPTALQSRIEYFVRVCSLERWVRHVDKYINN